MRKHVLFAFLLCATASLGLALKVYAGQAETQPQTKRQQTQPTGQQASGQPAQAARPPAIPPGMRLLSLKEGRAIAQEMAWADDEEGLAPDCSHLVHILYEKAGYAYPYASSMDLYRGTGQFVRVRHAQPGDLIVWRGHVGIVVDPKEHSFFSSVSEGARIQNYNSSYWRARGYARFFRYLTSSPLKKSGGTTEAAKRPPGLQPKEQAVISSAEKRPPGLQAVKTAPATASKARSEKDSASAIHAENSLQIPLRTEGKQPKAADVSSALEEANLDAGEILRAGNLERLERPVVVYRQLQVSGVELKGKRGTAQIQVETVAAVTAERMEAQQGWEDHQLELQRTKKGWVMTPAAQSVYVPRDGAMRILAARLAALTQNADRSTEKDREQADIIRFMNLLIQ